MRDFIPLLEIVRLNSNVLFSSTLHYKTRNKKVSPPHWTACLCSRAIFKYPFRNSHDLKSRRPSIHSCRFIDIQSLGKAEVPAITPLPLVSGHLDESSSLPCRVACCTRPGFVSRAHSIFSFFYLSTFQGFRRQPNLEFVRLPVCSLSNLLLK
jgi:hypothetical protein